MKDDKKFPNLRQINGWFHCDFIDPSGRRIQRSLKTKDFELAKHKLMKMQTEAYEKGYLDIERPKKVLFSELANKVLEYAKDRYASYRTVYSPMMKPMINEFGQKCLSEITTSMIEEYQARKKEEKSISYANRAVKVLKRAFNLGIKWSLTKVNPVRGIEFYREPKGRLRYLVTEEFERLLEYCSGELKNVVLLAVHTGMRKGEIFNLKWGNVDMGNRLMFLEKTKNGETREIPMSATIYKMLSRKYLVRARKEDEFVFEHKDGKAYTKMDKSFKRALKLAGINNFRFHDLRHTAASLMVMAGVDILTIKEVLGHKDLKTTQIYAHLAPHHKRQAIAKFEQYLKPENQNIKQDNKELAVI